MAFAVPIHPMRANPPPSLQEVRPLEAVDPSDSAAASKTLASRMWDGLEAQRREQILHYFNTIPGKFTLSEAQIAQYSRTTFDRIPRDIAEAVMKAIVGWKWDYILGDPLPAAQIIFGLGGYTLSQAGELAIQTFSLMPEAHRSKLVKTYAIWDDLKARAETAASGITMQTSVSEAARRARRNYAAWRTAWDGLTAEQKVYYFGAVRVHPAVTRISHHTLVGRSFDALPEDVKAFLYDRQQVNEIAAKINAGRIGHYTRMGIRTLAGTNEYAVWPEGYTASFINLMVGGWNEEPVIERAAILRFIMAHDPLLPQTHDALYHDGALNENQIQAYSQMNLYALADAVNAYALGHIAFYLSWRKLKRRFTEENLKSVMVGTDNESPILPVSDVPAASPERLDMIEAAAKEMWAILAQEEGTSYNQWVGTLDYKSWTRRLAYIDSYHDVAARSGALLRTNVRQRQAIRQRARFQPGQAVRVMGLANFCKVAEISEVAGDRIKYNIGVFNTAPSGPEASPGPVAFAIDEVEEDKLSDWQPWPLSEILSGLVWNDRIQLENRLYWMRTLTTRISSDVPNIPSDANTLSARGWSILSADVQKKFVFRLASRGLIAGLAYNDLNTRWVRFTKPERAGRILHAMSLIVGDLPLIVHTNVPRFGPAVDSNELMDLPLDYIYGLTVALSFPTTEPMLVMCTAVYDDIITRHPHASDEDAIYFAIGAGIEPETAVSMVRPVRLVIPQLAESKAFLLIKGYHDRIVARGAGPAAWPQVFASLIEEGRARVPELPAAPATDVLNAGWGASNYQNRYMMLIGAIGQDTVLQAYAEHEYQPPPSYIQAGSTNNISAIRDPAILQRLTSEFERVERNLDTLRRSGEEILTFIANSLNQTRQTGETEANRRAGVRWDALNANLRDFIMRYVRDEFVTEIPILDEYPTWDRLDTNAKNAIVTLSDWELAERYGAAKLLETQWTNALPDTRRKWILGLRLGLVEGEFQSVMSMTWTDYDQVLSRFTSEIILNMVNGVEGRYGLAALTELYTRAGTARGEGIAGTPIAVSVLSVCDFIRFSFREAVFYGFVVLIDGETIYGNWRSDFYEAYDGAPRLTLADVRGLFSGTTREIAPLTPSSEMQNIVRYERNHPLPVFADGWGGGAMNRAEAAAIRAPKIARMILEAGGDLPDRLLALLYPGGQADINVAFHVRSSWTSMPLDSRNWMIRTLLEEHEQSTPSMLSVTILALRGSPRIFLDQWLGALGGQTLVEMVMRQRGVDWPMVLLPLIAYAIRKARDGVSVPAGATPIPLTPPEAAPPAPTPVAPPPPHVTEAMMRDAWDRTSGAQRARVLRVVQYTSGESASLSRRDWEQLTPAQRTRLRREHREGTWEIRRGRAAVRVAPTPPTARASAPAPPVEAPEHPQDAWDRLTPEQRTPLRQHFHLTLPVGRMRWSQLSSTTRRAMTSAWRRGEWGLTGPAGAVWIRPPPEVPAAPPLPAPAATRPVQRTGSVSSLHVGDLVQHGLAAGEAEFGVVAHIGRFENEGDPASVWAIWGPTPEEAREAYTRMTPAYMRPLRAGGQLSFYRVQGPEHMVSVLERGIPRPSGLPAAPVKPPVAPPPPPAAPPARRPAHEDFFEDPFRRAIEANVAAHYRDWDRAQLEVSLAELEGVVAALRSVRYQYLHASQGGHGVPVPFLLVPLNMTIIAEVESAYPAIRSVRVWQRIKNAVRHRRGQSLVSLQVGEFYKSGKWWRQNTVKSRSNPENVGKHRHEPSTKYDRRQLEAGVKVEMEHTDDPAEALEIAKDHLDEIPDYYSRLLKMERKALRKLEKKALKKFRPKEGSESRWPVAFQFVMDENPAPAQFQMVRFRSDVYPIKVIDEFLQRHAEGWVTSFQRHYNLDRLPEGKRVYIAISTTEQDKPKPLIDKIIGVMGISRNRWDNIDDVFVAVHTGYRRIGVGKQMNILLFDIARKWINPETGRGARRVYLLVKDANEGSKRMVTSVGFMRIEQFLNTAGETVNRYVKELYEPPRENP